MMENPRGHLDGHRLVKDDAVDYKNMDEKARGALCACHYKQIYL